MAEHTNNQIENQGPAALPERIAPDAIVLDGLEPSAILPYLEMLWGEICYVYQVGYPAMDGATASAYLIHLDRQIDDLRWELVRRARQERIPSEPEWAVSAYDRQVLSTDLIRS